MTAETSVEQRWTELVEAFTAVSHKVTDWHAATVCEGWDAADLIEHIVSSQRDFAARNGREVPLFDGSRSMDRTVQFIKHSAAMEALAGDRSFIGQTMPTAVGEVSVGEALLLFYGFDLIVHRWDLGRSQGLEVTFTDAELDAMEAAIEAFGDQAYAPGIFAAPVQVPEGASRQVKLLARTGRKV